MRDLNELRRLAEAASPGEWTVWFEYAETDEKLKAALCEQVDYTPEQDRCGGVYMINADGKCPALTGCGPTSKENADFLVGAQPSTVLALIDRLERAEAEAARLRSLLDATPTASTVVTFTDDMRAGLEASLKVKEAGR